MKYAVVLVGYEDNDNLNKQVNQLDDLQEIFVGLSKDEAVEVMKKCDEVVREGLEDLEVIIDEPDCSACGDGGCIHCEPHRFIDGHIY